MRFPSFLYGTAQRVGERASEEAVAWAAAFTQRRSLPDEAMREIRPGELVYCVMSGDVDPLTPHWRLFGVSSMAFHRLKAPSEIIEAMRGHIRATPWGALAEATGQEEPNTVDVVTARLHALSPWWQLLSSLRYRGRGVPPPSVVSYPNIQQPIFTLDDLIAQIYDTTLETWGDAAGSVRTRIEHALAAMSSATEAESRQRLIRTMVAYVKQDFRLRLTPALTDAELVASKYDETTPEQRSLLRAAVRKELKNFLWDVAAAIPS